MEKIQCAHGTCSCLFRESVKRTSAHASRLVDAGIASIMKRPQGMLLSEFAIGLKRTVDGKVMATLCMNAQSNEMSTAAALKAGDILRKVIVL